MNSALGIGIVGCGVIGRTHLSALREVDDVMIQVCDRDVGAAALVASDFGPPPRRCSRISTPC
jgi:predicted dehydrogenase